MTQRRIIKQQLAQLGEIRNILDAMKNLAAVEIHKVSDRRHNQQQMIRELERLAADLLAFHPYSTETAGERIDIWILFGSERGFCGDFNTAVIDSLEQWTATSPDQQPYIIIVGDKLQQQLEPAAEKMRHIEGPDVTEDIMPVLGNLVTCIGELQAQGDDCNLQVLFHDADSGEMTCSRLLPPFRAFLDHPPPFTTPPVLNIPPADLFTELVDLYLYIALHETACMSLLAENYQRVQHMTGALQRLDERMEALSRRYHSYRQEEITEEIETILLNATV